MLGERPTGVPLAMHREASPELPSTTDDADHERLVIISLILSHQKQPQCTRVEVLHQALQQP
jgi:hypothetical protein